MKAQCEVFLQEISSALICQWERFATIGCRLTTGAEDCSSPDKADRYGVIRSKWDTGMTTWL